jgi:hypothetical protein
MAFCFGPCSVLFLASTWSGENENFALITDGFRSNAIEVVGFAKIPL